VNFLIRVVSYNITLGNNVAPSQNTKKKKEKRKKKKGLQPLESEIRSPQTKGPKEKSFQMEKNQQKSKISTDNEINVRILMLRFNTKSGLR
jgi:hypothetical protein